MTEAEEEAHGAAAAVMPAGDRDTFEPKAGDMAPEAVAAESGAAAMAEPKYQITLKSSFIEKARTGRRSRPIPEKAAARPS